jgi:hypothetical protein
VKVSFFRGGAGDKHPQERECTWDDLATMFTAHGHLIIPNVAPDKVSQQNAKTAQPMFSPAEYLGTRADENVKAVHFAVVDLDHGNPDAVKAIFRKVEADGIAYVAYSSWKHTPDHWSMRLLMPLDRPVPGPEWRSFWLRLNTYVDGLADPKCVDPGRPYFLPATVTERAAHRFVISRPGKALSVQGVSGLEVSEVALTSVKVRRPIERAEISSLAKKLVKDRPELGHALQKVLNGEPWAQEGHRDVLLFQLTGAIAKAFPVGEPGSIATFFEQACSHYAGDFTPKDVASKIARHQERIAKEEQAKLETAASQRKLSIQIALGPERTNPYTSEELAALATKLGLTQEALLKRWIIQRGGSIYVLCNGAYLGPWPIADSMLAAHTYLSPATSAGVRLEEISAFGEFVRRSVQTLSLDYGTPALHTVSDLAAQETMYDPTTKTIVEAGAPRRPLTPKHDPDVQRWLEALGGRDYPALAAWLSWLTELRLPCAALFIEGPPGCGKSLLAKGLARIWTVEAPTTLQQVLVGNFNQALERCPLVFGDERIPRNPQGRGTTSELREFIQADTRPLTRKHIPDATLRGAARVLIAANNHSILDGEENLTPWDVEAIVSRIVHIRVRDMGPDTASILLAKLGSIGVTRNWVTEDVIARHVLHLIETTPRPANPPRFLVEQESTPLHQALTTNTTMGSAVAHWLVSFLLEPNKIHVAPPEDSGHLVQVRNKQLLAHPRPLVDHWTRYKTGVREDRVTVKAISKALVGLSHGYDHRTNLEMPRHGRTRVYVIKTPDLITWADGAGFCSGQDIEDALARMSEAWEARKK